MQKKLEELAAGVCTSKSSILLITPEKLEFEALEGEIFTGEFSIECMDDEPVAGIVSSSNPRIECLNPQFQGMAAIQKFTFQSEGLNEGDSQSGNFHIISDRGEYIIPFSATVSKKYPDSSQGRIKSVFDFANLARKSYDEAVKVFSQPEFEMIFGPQDVEERLAFQGLMHKPCTRAQVEEFLIAARKKKRVLFQVEEAKREFRGITESQKQQITLKKEEWGHLAIEVITDGKWLRPLKWRLTEDDFVGSRGILEYMVQPEYFHAGNNYGRVILRTPFQKEVIDLCASEEAAVREHPSWEVQRRQVRLARDYLSFGTRKIVTGVWAKQTCGILEELRELEPDNLWYPLAKAQAYLANRQRQEAEWVLNSFPRNKIDKETPLYAYYLYLCTLREPEPGYVNKCTRQIRKIFHKRQDDTLILWILLFLDEDLNYSRGRKLEVIARHLKQGSESVLLYLEAWRILEKDPYLLGRDMEFDRKMLNFAVKHQALTKGMADQVVRMLPQIPAYDAVWYKILSSCYQASPERETLQAVCSYCIKGQHYGEKDWQWYQMGVQEELRIAGLHEAWVRSAGREQMKNLPRQIVLYFQSRSNFAGAPQAVFYRAMIQGKSQWKDVWPHYVQNIQEFALKQLAEGKINRDLAVIYQEVLSPDVLAKERADDLAKVLFSCEVSCANQGARNLVLCQLPLKKEQVVPIVRGKAYVNIYSSSWRILLEDAKGRRFVPEEELEAVPLLDCDSFLECGIACAEHKLPFLLKYFDKKKIWQTYEEEDLKYLQLLVEDPAISQAYREELRPQMVAYYYDNYTGAALDEFLLNLSFEGIGKQAREKVMQLLVARRHYKRAYELLLHYGCEHISPSKLVYVICYRMDELEQNQQEETDGFLLGLCRRVFLRGKYNERILQYLCRNFYGSLSEMIELWRAARNFELDAYELEERCLKRFLYTGDFASSLESVFESYAKNQGKDLVIQAYLSKMAHQYLVRDAVVADYVFQKIALFLREGQELNTPCKLGFLKWCASTEKLGEKETALAESLLAQAVRDGVCFSFYQTLPQRLQEKYLFHDRAVVEYHTVSQAKVFINYLPVGHSRYVEYEMKQMYDGVFAKEFQVFFGENIPYYIKEEVDGECKVTQSGHIQRQNLCEGEDSRYALINDMMAGWQMKDEATFLKCLESYVQMDLLVRKEFTVI